MREVTQSNNKSRSKTWPVILSLSLLATCSQGAQQVSATAGFAAVNETRLYYEMMGEGHPLVLIHGGGADRRMWDDQFKALAEHCKVIRYDLRGAGKSEIPKKRFSNVEDLHGLLRFLNVDKVYLLGLSRGGGVAADFTLEHPEMVDALILASSNLDSLPDAYRKMFSAAFSTARDEGVSRAVQVWMDDPYQAPA
ncbi:MAG: alpha/beta hydrolase, partial [Acidobacteria bacterium]|nr:alpha/beta hydrolase [Acidobacteriota bacterium]